MSFQFSLLMALPAVLGGIGTLWGPAVGAAIPHSDHRTDALLRRRFRADFDLIIYGLLVMGIALDGPEGIVGAFMQRSRRKAA